MSLKLFLLGAPQIEIGGEPVVVDTRKAVAMFAYLAVTGAVHTRDALAALLWPELDQSRARAALRRTLSPLRKALGKEGLAVTRDTIGVDPDVELWVDLAQFRALLDQTTTHGHPAGEVCPACLAPLQEAVALYRDDFMAGFTLRDAPDFDEWQFFEAEQARRELASALERLAAGYTTQGAYDEAISYAQRRLALDPLREDAHRQLMQLFAWAGRRNAALRQYRECVRVLEEELGVAPLEETTTLYEAIQEKRLPSPPTTAPPAVSYAEPDPPTTDQPAPAAIPLVGRRQEWQALSRAYEQAGREAHLVVLEGEAGIGKTRLAEEFSAHLRTQGALLVGARCYEGETHLAYAPFVDGLRAAIEQAGPGWAAGLPDLWLAEAARLVPELAALRPDLPPAGPLDGPGAQSRFFEGVRRVLLALAGVAPAGILFLDDVQWADAASLDLLTYLVRRGRGDPLLILVTWRSEGVPPDHRLRALLAEARRSDRATHLLLSRLQEEDIVQLVQATGTLSPEPVSARLYEETEGLPFFVVEYLAALADDPAGTWDVPRSVRDLVRSHLAVVDEVGRQLLGTAAVIGRSFAFDILRRASGRTEEETLAALETLLSQSILVEAEAGQNSARYDFSHNKVRVLVLEEMSLVRRRLLHRRVAEALAGRARDRAQAAQIARHYQLAGEDTAAAAYFWEAGAQARSVYANAEALAHFRSALALGHPDPAGVHAAVGDLQVLDGDFSAALNSYETAAALARPGARGPIEHKLGNVYQRLGKWDLAESHFQAALAGLDGEKEAGRRAHLLADWSRTAHRRGHLDEALALVQQALDLAEQAQDVRALAQAHNIRGILARNQGELATARHHLEESLRLADALSDGAARVAALNNLALVHSDRDETAQARTLLETALALCVAQGDRHREAALHNNLADLLHASGREEEAMAHLKKAVAIYADIGAEAGDWQPEVWKLMEW